jgi:hypothetical protein
LRGSKPGFAPLTGRAGPTTRPGEHVRVTNIPGSEAGPNSGPVTYGIAETSEAEGFWFKWDWRGRSSKHIPFEWSSETSIEPLGLGLHSPHLA